MRAFFPSQMFLCRLQHLDFCQTSNSAMGFCSIPSTHSLLGKRWFCLVSPLSCPASLSMFCVINTSFPRLLVQTHLQKLTEFGAHINAETRVYKHWLPLKRQEACFHHDVQTENCTGLMKWNKQKKPQTSQQNQPTKKKQPQNVSAPQYLGKDITELCYYPTLGSALLSLIKSYHQLCLPLQSNTDFSLVVIKENNTCKIASPGVKPGNFCFISTTCCFSLSLTCLKRGKKK